MTSRLSHRFAYLIGALLCAALIATALYFQYAAGLQPCPLCILQRVAFIAVGVLLLLGFLHNPRGWGRPVYGGLASMSALLGATIAARHMWLQNLPPGQVPECGPDLTFMLEAFPLQKALGLILRGSGECAEVQWSLLGLTMPGWSLVWLLGLALWSLFIAFRRG